MKIRIPTPVPATPSATTEPTASQPGASCGACATPNGSSATVAPSIVAVTSVIVSSRSVSRWRNRLAIA